MKNLIVAAIAVFVFVGCQKQTETPENMAKPGKNKLSIKVQDGRVIFPSETFYNNYFTSNGKKALLKSKITKSDFVSFSAARNQSLKGASNSSIARKCHIPKDLMEDNERFFSLLNKDGIIQVGDHVFRYNYCDNGVWVITKDDFLNEQYRDKFMSGELTKGIVGFFPSDVDAFKALEMGYISMPEKGTTDYNILEDGKDLTIMRSAHANDFYEHFFAVNDIDSVRFRGKLAYDKFAIYFDFYGKEKYQTYAAIPGWTTTSAGKRDWKVYYEYRCRRKGKNHDYADSGTLQPPRPYETGKDKVKKTFYDGSRGLKGGGYATWKVYNVLSNQRYVERKFGANWIPLTSQREYFGSYILTSDVVYNNISQNPIFGIGL